ncbi:MAG: methyltransferase domain-containing protein [Bdellovibrio sp.]
MEKDGWNPNQYEKFKKERFQPFFDLVELLQPSNAPRIIDLGCGTGELTKILHERFPSASTTGIDSSTEMLQKA